ncbi:hypothetical protein O181_113771 [Austropuccinia psidii MF-1]|uniref:Uncharacterized protein n=1 Tax=Austropuccinia psidii MF-1 TaxID=1389203 RepID=A0A9Q3PUR9_9BASI|nr:hypothetical protein [Austropuccinia psidii MF-1]
MQTTSQGNFAFWHLSQLTELTEYSPSLPPPSVLSGSEILSQLGSPWSRASSGNFDPHQSYYGYKAIEILDTPFSEFLIEGVPLSTIKRYFGRKKDGPFGKDFPVCEDPTSDCNSGYSSYAEGIDVLDSEEAGVINPLVYHSSSSSPTQPPSKKFHSYLIPSTPRKFQPVLSSLPSSIPPPSTSWPFLDSPINSSSNTQPRQSTSPASHQLQPVVSTSQRGEV